ncbi:guanine nucleotide-binding protein G(olf) subunit alpha-like [Latimeria chalumnae]|uniref:Guanine nucleotide-binding protein G(s) subunit alpha n=1 Tax=Latimeria chalumnae TaxID=7897 RepID=M3XH17_LATCH|nr:PREDICTED: guanine nucleotide-binding protein G(olf) subunit alpha-like [Latimeria chalumnae]|eukprot:XP_006009668.1 PREDICTED: guanine nucleotide-binding protein G(olf) subunit alpha-like [Latimeria chalumnae]
MASCVCLKRSRRRQTRPPFRPRRRVLLFGTADSGKTTILKQINYLYYSVLFGGESEEVICDIYHIIRDALVFVITNMSQLQPPVALANSENQDHMIYVQNHAANASDFSVEFLERVKILWQDEGVKECFGRVSSEFGCISCAKYFLDRVEIVKQVDYVPTVQDFMRCKSTYTSQPDMDFLIAEVPYKPFLSPGIRKHFYTIFSGWDIFIYTVDCSCFNEINSHCQNKLEEALLYFSRVTNMYCTKVKRKLRIPFLVFLNKHELLAKKLLSGRWRLEDYFPEFADYTTPQDATPGPDEDPTVTRAKYFIRDLFKNIFIKSEHSESYFTAFFITATDCEKMEQVFQKCAHFLSLYS